MNASCLPDRTLIPDVETGTMETIGDYLIKRLVGEGGMGRVYDAEERLSQRRVALKVLRPELARNEDVRRLFHREMQILAHLEHPNIVRCLACTETDGQLVMALEFLEGRTLREELTEKKRLSWSEVVFAVAQIAEGLAVAHAQEPPIVHRDLKPENVMRMPNGVLKVMDFGIAKVLSGEATHTQSIGTLQYMSPEQIDAGPIDARSDLYSLGLIFYEMVAGRAPFQSASPRELLNLQCTEPPPALPEDIELPQGVHELLFELLEKSPAQRPAGARQVLERLAPFQPSRRAAPRSAPSVESHRGGAPAGSPSAHHTQPSNRDETEKTSPPPGQTSAPREQARSESTPPRVDTVELWREGAREKSPRGRVYS